MYNTGKVKLKWKWKGLTCYNLPINLSCETNWKIIQ